MRATRSAAGRSAHISELHGPHSEKCAPSDQERADLRTLSVTLGHVAKRAHQSVSSEQIRAHFGVAFR
jgi:hypothetical protein